MRIKKPIRAAQTEYFCHCPGSDTAVVFIHGITEGTAQFKKLSALCVQNGMHALVLCLPGHGKNGLDFAKSGGKKWKAYVNACLDRMRKQYRHIFLVGHSMGALLALDTYCCNSGRIDGIVSFAAPYHLHITAKGVITSVKMALHITKKDDPYMKATIDSYNIVKCSLFTYPLWIRCYIDLYKMIRNARKQLGRVQCPILLLHCKQDEFSSLKCVKTFKKTVNPSCGKAIVFENAGHFFYREHKETIEQAILDFLTENNKK